MRTFVILGLCLLWPDPLCGQGFNPYQPPPDARTRRARLERAVVYSGGTVAARTAAEQYGDDFALAALSCPPEVARKLAEFAAAPDGLSKLPRPAELLRVIAMPNHGADVALWAIQHSAELTDVDQFGAFTQKPLEIALGLEKLPAAAARYHADRLALAAQPVTPQTQPAISLPTDWRPIAIGAAVVALIGWWLWRRRQGA